MSCELYFLRSSESKIVTDMLQYAHEPNQKNKKIYTEFYGLKPTDLGLYALHQGEIAGAIWSRELDKGVPVLSLAVVPKHRDKGVARQMMEQFFIEAAASYEELLVDAQEEKNVSFYEKFGFLRVDNEKLKMRLKLVKKEILRPSDGYDPTRWMD